LKSTLLALQLKRTELLTKYEPTYRLVQEVDQEIADTNNAINAEQAKPLRDETTDEDPNYLSVKTELTKAQADLDGLKARATAAASIAEQYRKSAQTLDQDGLVQQDLMRTAKTQAENYLLYAHKREEARISDALDRRRILNVAIAEQPIAPAFPNRSRVNFALLVLLLICGRFSRSLVPYSGRVGLLPGHTGARLTAERPRVADAAAILRIQRRTVRGDPGPAVLVSEQHPSRSFGIAEVRAL
jgi:uncharacterized protein involved in exopolysaccharide biosynthesis